MRKTNLYPGRKLNWGGLTVGGGSETIETYGHDLSDLGRRDVGGPFFLDRSIDTYALGSFFGSDAYLYWISPNPINDNWAAGNLPSESAIKAQGTTAIARTTPTSPAWSLSQAAGEVLKDGIPSIVGVETWRERTLRARSAGSEYLNVEFGWLPLVSDIRNFSRVVKNHKELMSAYYKGSGKNTRVGTAFPTSYTNVNIGTSNLGLRWGTSSIALSSPVRSGLLYKTTDSWFKGCYTYLATVPGPSNSVQDRMARYGAYADHLLGVRLTPELLWNLTPWSWAVDWFTNAGDIIHNVSEFAHDSLVLKYGYMMSKTRLIASASCTASAGSSRSSGSATFRRERLRRFPADPYFGFGTKGSLSGAQKAILLALGLSRTGF